MVLSRIQVNVVLHLGGLMGCVLINSGCWADEYFRSDQWTWLWAVLPFLGFGLAGMMLVLYRRKSQLADWDLRTSPAEPSAKRIVLWAFGVALVIALAFTVYNLLLDSMDPVQKASNVGMWLLGTIVGTAAALLLGLRMAEPGSLPAAQSRRR